MCLVDLVNLKILHGGVILSLTDTMGSLVIATKGQCMTGVSTDIGATFVRPGGKLGESVTIEGKLTAIGAAPLFKFPDSKPRYNDISLAPLFGCFD
jgi:acyl-coenzyme A thioesterase PaaI-like protein